MKWFVSLLAHWRHVLFHRGESILERGQGEVFLRCLACGLRSEGLKTGPSRVVLKFPGDPERFKLSKTEKLFSPVAEMEITYHEQLAATRHAPPVSKHVH